MIYLRYPSTESLKYIKSENCFHNKSHKQTLTTLMRLGTREEIITFQKQKFRKNQSKQQHQMILMRDY
jgi:hypothetical protein